MDHDNSDFALGNTEYTLADVFFTTMLARLTLDKVFFNANVLTRPRLKKYWEKAQLRPSFKAAKLETPNIPSTFMVCFCLLFALTLLSLVFMGIPYLLFPNKAGITNENIWIYLISFMAVVVLLVTCYLRVKRYNLEKWITNI